MNSSHESDQAPAGLEQPTGHVSTYFRFAVGKLKSPSGSLAEDGTRLVEGCIAHLGDPSRFPPALFILLPTPSFVPYRPLLIGVRNKLADLGFGNVPLIGASVAVCVFDSEAHEQGAMLVCLASRLVEARASVGLDAQNDPEKAVGDILRELALSGEQEMNPFDDHFLLTFLPGLAEGSQASECRADELMAEIRDHTLNALPIFGGVASNGIIPQGATYQFLNDGVYTGAAVVALVKCRLVRVFALAEGLKEGERAFRVRGVSQNGHVVTEFHEGSPTEIAAQLAPGAFLGEFSPEGEQIAAIPYLVGEELHFRRRFRDRSILRVWERDLPGMKDMAPKLVQEARQRSDLRLSRLAGLLFIGCTRRYREREALDFDPAEALRLAAEKSPGTEAVGCYMEGELGLNRHGRSVLGFWSLSMALFGDDVSGHAQAILGFEALAAETKEASKARSLDQAIECVLHAVEEAGYQGGMVSLVLHHHETQWIVARKGFGEKWVEEVLPRTRQPLPGDDVLAEVAREGHPRFVKDSTRAEEHCNAVAIHAGAILSQYIAPLLDDGGRTIALLQIDLGDMRDTQEIRAGQEAVLDAMAALAGATISRVMRANEIEIARQLDQAMIACFEAETAEEAAVCFARKAAAILQADWHVRLCSPNDRYLLRLVGGEGGYYRAAKEERPAIDIDDQSPSAEAVLTENTVFCNHAQNDEGAKALKARYQDGALAREFRRIGSYAIFPIALPGQRPTGVISFSSEQPWFFTESSLRSLKEIGQRAGVLLTHVEQKRREQEQRLKAEETVAELTFLIRATPHPGKAADIHEALEALTAEFGAASHAEVVSCYLWCEEQQRYVLRGQWGWAKPEWVDAAWYARGEGMTGNSALLTEPRYIPSLRSFRSATHVQMGKYPVEMFGASLSSSATGEVIALPLRFREKALGIVTLLRIRPFPIEAHESSFATTDPEILRQAGEHLSALVYALLENDQAQWEQQEAQRLSNIQERLLQNQPLDQLLAGVCDALVKEYRATRCTVFLADEERAALVPKAHDTHPASPCQPPTALSVRELLNGDQQLLALALTTGQPQESRNPAAADQRDPEKVKRELLVNRLCLPINLERKPVGVLDICWEGAAGLPGHGAIPRPSRQRLKRIADSIAQTIDSRQLREEREKSLEVAKTAKQALDGMALVLQKSFHDLAKGVQGISCGLSDIKHQGVAPAQAPIFEECHRIVERLARVLEEARDIGWRLAPPQRGICRLDNLLHEAVNRHGDAAAQASVDIVVRELKEVSAEVDATLIAKCLDNVIENAIEAMPHGGRLDCSIRRPRESQCCMIVISDTGKGMSQRQVEEALNRPESSSEWSPGQQIGGVGLFLTRLYCRSHGGDAKVDSHPGSGTTVILTIPVH